MGAPRTRPSISSTSSIRRSMQASLSGGTLMRPCSYGMVSIPGSTIHTLRELFEDGAATIGASPFAEHIRKLDPTSQAYFQNQFFTKTYSQTKQQIARRLYTVLRVPAFERMFAAKTNKLDMFEAMQN